MARKRPWLDACNKSSYEAFTPGTDLVVDETMVFWTGEGDAHPTYLPCKLKPTPLGMMLDMMIMFTTLGDSSRICLLLELFEGAARDSQKEN